MDTPKSKRQYHKKKSFDKFSARPNLLETIAERQTLLDLQKEIEELRQVNDRERDEINMLRERQSPVSQQGNVGSRIVNDLVAGLRVLNIDTKVPKFEDDLSRNPNEFLSSLNSYFASKQIPENFW